MDKAKVYIGVPTRGPVDAGILGSVQVAIQRAAGLAECRAEVKPFASATIARNWLGLQTLRMSDCTHLFFVDDDTPVPADALERLLWLEKDYDADICTGVTPILKADGVCTNIQRDTDASEFLPCWPTGRFRIARCGTSCLLIRRRVLEGLKFPWFTYYQDPETGDCTSEDLPFCDHAREAGFKLYCDAAVICGHMKNIDIRRLAPAVPGAEQKPRLVAAEMGE